MIKNSVKDLNTQIKSVNKENSRVSKIFDSSKEVSFKIFKSWVIF